MLPAVTERTLLILAALGAAVVAFAVYHLMTREMQQLAVPADVRGAQTTPAPADQAPSSRAGTPRTGPRGDAVVKTPPTPAGPPPPLPMPEISLEEAREDYADLMAELRGELRRNEDTGKPLANEHWVDYYRRGHEVMNPLRRLLGFEDEDAKREVAEKDEALRTLLEELQKDPAGVEPDPAPVEPQNQ